jgi:hypothetical protein
MINNLLNNLQIGLFEGPHSFINFAFSIKFDEYLSLTRPGRRIWKKLDYQWNITNQSVFQPSEHIPQNGPVDLSEEDVPKLAVQFEVFFGAVTAGDLLGESVSKFKISRGKMTVRRSYTRTKLPIRANFRASRSRGNVYQFDKYIPK